jgi:hypothetical protein
MRIIRRMRGAGHVTCMGEKINAYRVLLVKPEVKKELEALGVDFFGGATTPSGPGSHHSRGFYITHNDATQSVRLIWTGDHLVAETST